MRYAARILPVAMQVIGALVFLYGLFLLVGAEWTLVVSGLLTVAGGTIYETAQARLDELQHRKDGE